MKKRLQHWAKNKHNNKLKKVDKNGILSTRNFAKEMKNLREQLFEDVARIRMIFSELKMPEFYKLSHK